jgi:DNA-binding NtrC family response regulator
MTHLMKHAWPGNVRELENTLIQGILSTETDTITCADILLKTTMAYPGFDPDRMDHGTLQKLPYKEAKEKMLTLPGAGAAYRSLKRTTAPSQGWGP